MQLQGEYTDPTLYFVKSATGGLACCIQGGQSNEPVLVALATPEQCSAFSGELKPRTSFQTFICQVPEKTKAIMKPIRKGKMMVRDQYQLVSGDRIEMIGLDEAGDAPGLSMAVSMESLLAHVFRAADAVFKSYFLCDFDFDFPADLQHVVYGTYQDAAGLHPNIFAIADAGTTPGTVLTTFEIDGPGLRIAIVGNALDNDIKTLAVPFACTGGEVIQPCDADWDLEAMIIAGLGGSDNLRGIRDADTRNVIYGDFVCGLPPAGESAGNDHIFGGHGDDILCGEQGNDWIRGLAGNDQLYGNLNSCEFLGDTDDDHIFGGEGDDTIYGDFPDSSVAEGGRDIILGMGGNDRIFGGPGDDDLFGDSYVWAPMPDGDDVLCGGAGRDFLSPGPGHDEIFYNETEDDILQYYPGEPAALDFWSQAFCPYWPPEE